MLIFKFEILNMYSSKLLIAVHYNVQKPLYGVHVSVPVK